MYFTFYLLSLKFFYARGAYNRSHEFFDTTKAHSMPLTFKNNIRILHLHLKKIILILKIVPI